MVTNYVGYNLWLQTTTFGDGEVCLAFKLTFKKVCSYNLQRMYDYHLSADWIIGQLDYRPTRLLAAISRHFLPKYTDLIILIGAADYRPDPLLRR